MGYKLFIKAIWNRVKQRIITHRILTGALGVLTLTALITLGTLADNAVRVVKMTPNGEVMTKTNLVFYFSSDVVPKSRVGKLTATNKLRFRPAIPGKIRWETPRRLKFYPEVALQPSTAYTVEFMPDIASELKKTLGSERILKFTTERFRVTESSLNFVYNPKRKKGILFQARLNFNYPVSAESLRRQLSVGFADTNQPIRFNVRMSNGGREALVTTGLLQRGNTARKIEISLPEGFLCLGGTIGLKNRYGDSTEFRERRALTIVETDTQTEGRNAIVIRCSEPPDSEVLDNFVSIKPAVKVRMSVNGESIILSGDKLKAGRTYEVRIAKGLPALNGHPLERDVVDSVTFPDLEPSVAFNSPGRYLSMRGNLNLGIETVNVSQVEVEITKIFANNIVAYLGASCESDEGDSYSLSRMGRVLDRQTMAVRNVENEFVTTPLNLRSFISDKRRGIFRIMVCDPENRWRQSTKMVIVTDLGLLVKKGPDEMMVWVNSLEDLKPKAGVRVSVISLNNQELLVGETDAQGVVRFQNLRRQIQDFNPYLVVAEEGDDLSFVNLEDSLIDKTDFPTEGRQHLSEGYEAFLYTDRGVYRPGEQTNLVAVVRGANAATPPEFPVRLEVIGPDGMVFREYADNTKNDGLCQFKIDLPDYARTGGYTASLYVAKQSIGSISFNVEEFMPDRIKVETFTDKERYYRGDAATIKVRGMNLYGPPATGRRVDLSVRLEPVPFTTPLYRSFDFGSPGDDARAIEETLGQDALDMKGEAEFNYDFPDNLTPLCMVRGVFQSTVTEDGGRSVSSFKTVEYHPRRGYIGLKRGGDYYAKTGEAYPVRVVEVTPEGKPVKDATLTVEVYKVTWNSIYRRDSDGHYTYHTEREEDLLGTSSLKLGDGETTYTYRPQDWGCYKVVFIDPATRARNVMEFYASGWGYAPWAMDHPDRVQLDLDKASYTSGQTATLQIKAPFSGRALVTVEREKVYDVMVVDLKENTGVVSIPVKAEYLPNVYVSVEVIRATKKLDKRAPTRAFGTVPLTMDSSSRKLDLRIDAAEEIRPNQEVEVTVTTNGGQKATYITLAAVDEGILQLTEFETPNPMGFFYGKRALNLDTHDLYGMLLPEVEGVQLPDSPGGDEGERIRRKNLNPVSTRRVKPVSLWSGVVKPDGQGKARIRLKIPQFNGTLRLMAVGMSGPNFGSATQKMLVRDPIVLTSTFPRFAAPGDRFVIPVSVFNGTGREGAVELKLTATGPVDIDGHDVKRFSLKEKEEKAAHFAAVAKDATGACQFKVEAVLNGEKTTEITELAVRPAQPYITKAIAGTTTTKKPTVISFDGTWLPGTGETTLYLAPLPGLRYAGSLRFLLSYPYGCVEQTTSKVFPLLYFADLAGVVQPELSGKGKAEYYVNQGIVKLESMQNRDGGFSYWPGMDWSCPWSSIYAAHFLVEARKAGYTVSDRVYNRMTGFLNKIGRARTDNAWDLERRVYALYVLALAGKPQLSSMAYVKGQKIGDLHADSRMHLAAAYYYAGDKKTARELMPAVFAVSSGRRDTGRNYYSAQRVDAIALGLLADIDPSHAAIPKLVQRLSDGLRAEHWGTTQENAFAFMALGKLYKKKTQNTVYTGEVLVNGTTIASFDHKSPKRISDARLKKGKVTIKIEGSGECYYYAESSGVPMTTVSEVDKGIAVRREIFDRDGKKVNLNEVKQGDLLVVRIAIKTSEDNMENVVIADLLPSGLEIENPRLASSAKIGWLSRDTFTPSYMDIRDDRLLLFASFNEASTYNFYYAVRAVSCGSFTLPPIKAECMYEPEIVSIKLGGKIQIEK